MPRITHPKTYRFATFEARLPSNELFRQGRRVALADKPFVLLIALLETPGELVTRESLQERLWSAETFVDFDNNLNATVRKLREALDDSASSPRFIETLPRRGYRFIGPVEVHEPIRRPETASPKGHRSFRLGLIAGLALAFAAVMFLGYTLASRSLPTSPANKGKVRLAVLPFADLSAGDNKADHLPHGLMDELITQLGRLQPEQLAVVARVSAMTYLDTSKTVRQIGDELKVEYVLEGTVRSERNRLRVTARLIQVADQSQLWSEVYERDRGELLAVQEDLARRVAKSLAVELLGSDARANARAATANTEAFEEYLRGRYQWSRFSAEGYRRAASHFERAIEVDPAFAPAWAGLADAFNLLAFSKKDSETTFDRAREAALRALTIDPQLADAHNSLGFIRLYADFDPLQSLESFRQASVLAPNDAMVYHWQAGALSALERHDEAIAVLYKSLELDPVSASVRSDLGWYLLFADRYEEGLFECEQTLALDPQYGWAKGCRQLALERLGRYDEALQVLGEQLISFGLAPSSLEGLASMESSAALREARVLAVKEARGWPASRQPSTSSFAFLEAQAGNIEQAIEQLEAAWAARDPWLVFLRVDPRLDTLHGHPRFEALAREILEATEPIRN